MNISIVAGINAVMYFGPKILKAAHVGNEFLLNIVRSPLETEPLSW